jgi:hypothetical protein
MSNLKTQGLVYLTPASQLRTVRTPRAALLIDYRGGSVTMLADKTMQTWLTCVNDQHPIRSEESTTDAIVAEFVRRGWLVAVSKVPGPHVVVQVSDTEVSWGTKEVPARLAPAGPAPWPWRLAAVPAVAFVLAVGQCGDRQQQFARLHTLTRLGARLPIATSLEIRRSVRAVRWAARLIPARVACLEESVAAIVLLAATGRRATWCHGIATDPVRLHAWLADRDGRAVEEPADTDQYTLITPAQIKGREGANL